MMNGAWCLCKGLGCRVQAVPDHNFDGGGGLDLRRLGEHCADEEPEANHRLQPFGSFEDNDFSV